MPACAFRISSGLGVFVVNAAQNKYHEGKVRVAGPGMRVAASSGRDQVRMASLCRRSESLNQRGLARARSSLEEADTALAAESIIEQRAEASNLRLASDKGSHKQQTSGSRESKILPQKQEW